MDAIDRLQDAEERLAAQRPRPRADRLCIRCGYKLPEQILVEDRDALDCGGSCGRLRGA